MTTNYGGADSTVVQQGVWIGVTADAALMDMVNSTPADQTYVPISQIRDDAHNIGLGDIVVTKNVDAFKKVKGIQTLGNTDSKNYGRPLAFAQHGNLPTGDLSSGYFNQLTTEDKEELKKQTILDYVSFVGIAQDSFRKAKGPDETPLHDGIPVLIHGFTTVGKVFAGGKPLRPMASLVLALCPKKQTGRMGAIRYQSDGPERYPFMFEEHDSHQPTAYILVCFRALQKYLDDQMAGKSSSDKWNVLTQATKSPMLFQHRVAAAILIGLAGLDITETDSSVAAASMAAASMAAASMAAETSDTMGDRATKWLDRIVGKLDTSKNTAYVSYMGIAGLTFVLNACQDVAARSNRIVGKCIQSQQPRGGPSSTLKYDLDCLFTK